MKRAVLWCIPAFAPILTIGSAASAAPVPASGTFHVISFPKAVLTEPNNINDNGIIVGCYRHFRTSPMRGFIDKGGKFITVNDPAAGSGARITACLVGVNKLGTTVGDYQTSGGVLHGLRYQAGTFSPVNAPGAGGGKGEGTVASTINDSGTIGGIAISSRHVMHGFVLAGGKFKPVNDPHAGKAANQGTAVTGISDTGLVVGYYVDSKSVLHGFEDRGGTFTTVNHVHASALPGKGTFIGCVSLKTRELTGEYFRATGPGIGFAGQVGHFHPVSDPAATKGTSPSCANDAGRIVGIYANGHGTHGFEFIP